VRREETLRGRGTFSALYRDGSRLDGEVIRCFFRCEEGAGASVRAGFSVSGRLFGAVMRNRMKRLMRAAFDAERDVVDGRPFEGRLTAVFVYRGSRAKPAERLKMQDVRQDMQRFCRTLAAAKPGARR
jgi:ribonuclease P protein component